jgi:hypothetical protein
MRNRKRGAKNRVEDAEDVELIADCFVGRIGDGSQNHFHRALRVLEKPSNG